jgi:hypothetical protein
MDDKNKALEAKLETLSLDELLPEVQAIMDKIPKRDVAAWDDVNSDLLINYCLNN